MKKYRIRNMIFTFLAMIFIFNLNVNAQAQKDICVELKQDYTSCSFKLEFEVPGDYTANLVSPSTSVLSNTTVTPFSKIDNSNMLCNVSKCKAGKWIISVIDPNADTPNDICKVKVLTEATKEKEADVVDSIKIGKDISGLKMFFVDSELNVTWTDETCGNVTISVVNTSTNEVIDTSNVNKKEYKCNIPEDVSIITVSVVPTVSAKISDAIQSVKLNIDREPKGTVIFDDIDYTNRKFISSEIDIQQKYGIEIYVNDKKVSEESIKDIGTYDINIPLSSENNNIVLYLVDENGNKYSFTKNIILDTISPTLELEEEYDGLQTTESDITIVGKVSDYEHLFLNGNEFSDVKTDGHFSIPCALHLGDNSISIKAVDKANNIAEYSMNIVMVEQNHSYFGLIVILVFLIVIVIVSLIIRFIKKKKMQSIDEENDKSDTEEVENDTEYSQYDEDDELAYVEDDEEYDESEENEEEEGEEMSLDEYEELERNKVKVQNSKREIIKFAILCAFLIVFLKLVITPCIVPTASMEPTINAGDVMLLNELTYIFKEPERGDIVVFKSKEYNLMLNKRIIGLPNDEISFRNGYVYINGEKLEEDYLDADIETNCQKSFIVPNDCYFMLGDNRENSKDSRVWKQPYIDKKYIKGAVLVKLPVSEFSSIFKK